MLAIVFGIIIGFVGLCIFVVSLMRASADGAAEHERLFAEHLAKRKF